MRRMRNVILLFLYAISVIPSVGVLHAQGGPGINRFALAWSADSRRLAVGHPNGVLVTDNGRVAWTAQTSDPVIGLLFSTDGTTLYGATADTDLYAWDIVTGETRAYLLALEVHPSSPPAQSARFRQTSRYITVRMGSQAPIIHALLDKDLNFIETLDPFGFASDFVFVGDDIVGSHIDFNEQTITIERNRQLVTTIVLEHPLDRGVWFEVGLSRDGRYLFVQATPEAPLALFDTSSGARLESLPSSTGFVPIVGDCMAYMKPDETFVLYNLTSLTQVAEYASYSAGENVSFTENGILHRDGQTFTLARLADCTVQTFDVPFDETRPVGFRIYGDDMVLLTFHDSAPSEVIIVDPARDHLVRAEVPYFDETAYLEPNRLLFRSSEGTVTIDTETGAILTRFLHERSHLFAIRPDGMAYAYLGAGGGSVVIQYFDGTVQAIILP